MLNLFSDRQICSFTNVKLDCGYQLSIVFFGRGLGRGALDTPLKRREKLRNIFLCEFCTFLWGLLRPKIIEYMQISVKNHFYSWYIFCNATFLYRACIFFSLIFNLRKSAYFHLTLCNNNITIKRCYCILQHSCTTFALHRVTSFPPLQYFFTVLPSMHPPRATLMLQNVSSKCCTV